MNSRRNHGHPDGRAGRLGGIRAPICAGAVAKGQNIYAITAPLACAAVERLLEGKFRVPGANAPGFIFDADEMLASLGADKPSK
jgi:hypothetical protein